MVLDTSKSTLVCLPVLKEYSTICLPSSLMRAYSDVPSMGCTPLTYCAANLPLVMSLIVISLSADIANVVINRVNKTNNFLIK